MNSHSFEGRIDLTTGDGVAALEAHVRCRLGGQVRDFRLVVVGNGVTLRGHSRTYYAKQLAQHTVMQAARLPVVGNEIEVA